MRLLNFLSISFLLVLASIGSAVAQRPCKEIRAIAEVKDPGNGNQRSVAVTVEGNSNQFRIHLIAPRKEENRLDLPIEEIKNLSPGEYTLIITESKSGEYCPKRLKVVIK